jgi:hypothetical protein
MRMMNSKERLLKILDERKAKMEADPTRRFVVMTRTPERSEWLSLRDASRQRPMLYTLSTARETVEKFRKGGVDARFVGVHVDRITCPEDSV